MRKCVCLLSCVALLALCSSDALGGPLAKMNRPSQTGFDLAGDSSGGDTSPLVDPPVEGNRAGTAKKGSLLVFAKIELKWNADGTILWQDTFIDLTNDYPGDVLIQVYYVNGDEAIPAEYDPFTGDLIERAHPGWNKVDFVIPCTQNQPLAWSAALGGGIPPFTILDPGFDANGNGVIDPFEAVGRPDDDPCNVGGRVLRGFMIAFAVNADNKEIRWNHLKGDALIVDYFNWGAWETNAWAFRALSVPHGDEPLSCTGSYDPVTGCTGTELIPGQLDMDGFEYDACPATLLFDFYASGGPIVTDTDLTLYLCDLDLTQGAGPKCTKADFDIWNQWEVKFSETERCICCWDQTRLSEYTELGIPNNFLIQNLQTIKGKARINGHESTVCPGSQDTPLLGLASKWIDPAPCSIRAGMTLVGSGDESAQIFYDVPDGPDELVDPFDGEAVEFGVVPHDEVAPSE